MLQLVTQCLASSACHTVSYIGTSIYNTVKEICPSRPKQCSMLGRADIVANRIGN